MIRVGLLAQRLAERAGAVLGEVVDAAAVAGHPARHRADGHHVGALAWAGLGGAAQRGRRRAAATASSLSLRRAASATAEPWAASGAAVAAPMPLEAPVTSASSGLRP